MINYDFLNLSPIEFENLSRDLLQLHYKTYFESFKEGKDQGIDLRCSHNRKKTILVQCKRYTDYKSLLANLKKEVKKVAILKPNRYVVITSAGLTPSNKEIIFKLFSPFIESTEDIFGKNDINNLLGQFPEVEKNYYKLWLSSTAILHKLLHNEINIRSEFLQENILKNIKIFVQNDSFNGAVNILNEHNFVILSGNPGVGKSTLAKMLVYEYIIKDFELIEVSSDIEEGFKVFKKDKAQVFYYDDFLGRNFLEKTIQKNEDVRLQQFIDRIRNSKNKILVMATREYILNQAKQKFDVFGKSDFVLRKYIVDLDKYHIMDKARIFYNHLFYSEISSAYLQYILKDKRYNNIIQHSNYNPRVIEFMTFKLDKNIVFPKNYYETFIANLENPEEIWKLAFENQISDVAKYILYALIITQWEISKTSLLKTVQSIMINDSHQGITGIAFNKALKELENTFISTRLSHDNATIIGFQNPSVRDFMINYIKDDKETILMLIESAVYFNQYFTIFSIDSENSLKKLFKKEKTQQIRLVGDLKLILEKKIILKFKKMEYIGYDGKPVLNSIGEKILYLHQHYSYKNLKINRLIANQIEEVNIEDFLPDEKETWIDVIKEISDLLNIDVDDFIENFINCIDSLSDVKALLELSKIYPNEYKYYLKSNKVNVEIKLDEAINREISDLSSPDENEIEGYINEIEPLQIKFNMKWTNSMKDLEEMLEELNSKENQDDYYKKVINKHKRVIKSEKSFDKEIEIMFSSLV